MSVLLLSVVAQCPAQARPAVVDFARDVEPILTSRCIRCHGPKKQEAGLRLDIRRRAFSGGDSGPVILPKDSGKSEMIRRILAKDEHRMPPSGPPLDATEIAKLRAWIDHGAAWPDELAGRESYEHWAYVPPRSHTPPTVKDVGRVRSPIDAFLIAPLEKKGFTFAADAAPRTLLRRLHLDLIGLPPTPEEVENFLNDQGPDAYERLVDRLLASPHFGERWGRHWLDLARFAESDGYENDRLRPDAWRYRDWVIDAVNRDLPFDEFTIEQLAGDLLKDATVSQKVATGFHRNTLWNSAASADKEEFRTRAVKDRTDTTATIWLGLTSGCAQCHSHKYDPLSQREYYQLYAFFNNTDHEDIKVEGGQAPILREKKRVSFVHRRGNFLSKGADVQPDVPGFLSPLKMRGKTPDRLDLAHWLVDPQHPLTARVAVNHAWQHLFGEGLVHTPENFGLRGAAPTHPELLDWLAREFVRLKWSRKALIRAIVLSTAYRQDSRLRSELTKVDPENRLLGRQNRVRVEAEIIRDAALSVSGLLDKKLGGPSIVPPFPEGFLSGKFTSEALKMPTKERNRRSVYIHVQRTLPHPVLAVFDGADGNQSCPRRDSSTTATQALTLLNDPVFAECAAVLGKRIRAAGKDRNARIDAGFRFALGRPPRAAESKVFEQLVQTQEKLGASEEAIWHGVARVLINVDEFITRE